MPLPATITGSWSEHRNSQHGPFLAGGNLYVFTCDTANSKVRAYKSTDGGSTWAEQDAANAASLSAIAGFRSFSATQAGSLVTIGGSLGFKPFDTSTDTWGAGVAAPGSPSAAANVSGAYVGVYLRRSNGNVVVVYQGASISVMGQARRRFYTYKWDGAAWTAVAGSGDGGPAGQWGGTIAAHFDLRAAVLGASDRVEIVYTRSDDTANVYKRSMSPANVVDTAVTFAGSTTDAYAVGLPVSFVNGANTEIAVPFNFSSALYVARWNSGADAAVTTTAAATGHAPESVTANVGQIAVDGTTKHLFFVDAFSDDVYTNDDGGSNTWGTEAAQEATITCQGVNAGAGVSGPGVLFNDNGAVKFDELSIGPGTLTLDAGKVASGAAVRGADLAPGAATLAAGKAGSAAAVRGVALTGTATLQAGKVPSGAAVRGATLTSVSLLLVGRIASGAAVRGAGLAPQPIVVAAGKVGTGAAVRGANLGATATLPAGKVVTAEAVRGADLVVTAPLSAGKVVSGAAVRGANLGGTATLPAGKIGTGAAVRGASLSGTATLPARKVASGAAVRGAGLAPQAVGLAAGKVATGTAVHGAALAPGSVTLLVGKAPSAAVVRGVALGRAGSLTLLAGKVPSAVVLQGITLTAAPVALAVGRVASSVAVGGVVLSPGAVTLAAGSVPAGLRVGGVTLATAAVTLAAGKVPAGAVVRGVTLAQGALLLLVLRAAAVDDIALTATQRGLSLAAVLAFTLKLHAEVA